VIKLLSFIIEIRDAIILLICILFSIVLMVGSESDPGAPFRQITLNTIGKIGGYIYRIDSYFNLRTKVQELKERNAVLALKNLELEDALLENIRLRKMLDFKDKTKYRLIPAEVIGQNPQSIINGLILNEGTERNLEKGNAVFTADGLVGKLVKVDSDNSLCQILLDRNSRISAKIQRNRELGIISWDGGEMLKLLYVAKTIQDIASVIIQDTASAGTRQAADIITCSFNIYRIQTKISNFCSIT